MIWWCPVCGLVWADAEPPTCVHEVLPDRLAEWLDREPSGAPAPRVMDELPAWHPIAKDEAA